LQYAHARIRSILARSGGEASAGNMARYTLPSNEEGRLARELLAFSDAVDAAASELAPHRICKQLHRISQAFGSFYEHCPVLIEDPSLRVERISLCTLTGDILQAGLELLGIDAPSRM
jgi:arginyl-tRNA synthetase